MPPDAERRPRREGGAQDAATSASRVAEDLGAARVLAAAGARFFCAYPDPEGKTESGRQTGFMLPKDWEGTSGAWIDAWKPGMALCMVTGHGLDVVDEDPRNGGDLASLNGIMPTVYAQAATPSGGTHSVIASLGVRKAKKNGIDVQAGDKDGRGRGFVFVAPTVRKSKVTGELVAYKWTRPPDPGQLRGLAGDKSGARLAELVRSWSGTRAASSHPFQQPSTWWNDNTGPIPKGERHDKLVSYAGKLRDIGLPIAEAEILMLRRLEDCEQPPAAAYPVTREEALGKLHDVYNRYEAGPAAETAAEPASLAERYAPVNWHEAWSAQPEQTDWLLEPILERGTINALFAKPGTGKSLLALEISARLSISGVTVVYVDEENRISDVVERLQAFGCTAEQLGRLRFYSFAGLPALDTMIGGVHLKALAEGNGAELVVLDTTTRLVAGRENDSDTFLQLYRCSLVPLKARGITVLRLDHPGKDISRGQRGSSAKDGDVDTIWRLEEITPTRFRLEREKSRNGHGQGALELRRLSEPLRHEWSQFGNCPEILIAAKLDKLGVPPDAGRPAARKALTAAGVKASNNLVEAAIRYRKNCPGQEAGSTGSSADARLPARTVNRYGQAGSTAPFWCEECDRTHPLSEHQACRDSAAGWPADSYGEAAQQ